MQNQWYIARDGKQYGPVSDTDLAQLVKDRELLDGDYLWRNGFDNWLPAAQVSEVRDLASNVSAPPATQKAIADPNRDAIKKDNSKTFTPDTAEQLTPLDKGANADFNAKAQVADAAYQTREQQVDAFSVSSKDTSSTELVSTNNMSANPMEQRVDVQDLVEDEDRDLSTAYGGQHQKGAAFDRGHAPLGGAYPNGQNVGLTAGLGAPERPDGRSLSSNGAEQNVAMNAKVDGGSKSGASWPLILGIGVGALFLLLIAATFALPFIVPPETIKHQISSVLKEKTGRDVSIKGKMSYRFFPSFGIDLNNIVIHNPPEIKGPDFVSIGRLQANLKLLPLISKKVEVDRIILHRPEVALIDNGAGQTNYEIKTAALFNDRLLHNKLSAAKKKQRSFKVAQEGAIDTSDLIARTLERLEQEEAAKKTKTPDKTATEKKAVKSETAVDPKGPSLKATNDSAAGDEIKIGEIEIINGGLKLINQKANSETQISAINLRLQAPAPEKDITAQGSVRFRQDRINLKGSISTLGQLLKKEPVKTKFDVKSERFEGKFDGQLRLKDGLEYHGDTDIQTFSLQKLLSWLDIDVPKQGYGGAYVRGTLAGRDKTITLKKATIKVDKTTLIGDLQLKHGDKRPAINAILQTDYLDLDPYLVQKQEIKRGDIKGLFGSQKTAVAAWNSEKIDLSFLNAFDGAVQLDAGKLIAGGHSIEKVRLNAKLIAGLMTAVMPKFQLYGGSGQMNLALNGAKSRPSLKSKLNLKSVQIKPLLIKGADIDFISGTADVLLDVVSSGINQSQFISGLNGSGKITVADGALKGVNIPGLLRNVQSGRLDKLISKPSETTDFSELNASFSINNGIVSNQDLLMKGPLLRMGGKGLINLPTEQIDYGVTPKLVSNLAGQGGADENGISVPLLIKGPLAGPSITPDLKGILSNGQGIDATVKTVEKLVKGLKKKKISSEEMKGLLNGMIKDQDDGGVGNLLEVFYNKTFLTELVWQTSEFYIILNFIYSLQNYLQRFCYN